MTYVFDNTFAGLLSCIFEIYGRKDPSPIVMPRRDYLPLLTETPLEIDENEEYARRVWKGIQARTNPEWSMKLFIAFLSELPGSSQTITGCIRKIFDRPGFILSDYGDPDVMELHRIYRKVMHEQHRMKAFVRFSRSEDDLYVAVIEPDHDILSLIVPHFKRRFADQKWIIYDKKRKYGIYYDLQELSGITLPEQQNFSVLCVTDDYSDLWKEYFKNINIRERKNLKLHMQLLPARYWKYLTEKQP